jgi:serine/threonine-protein kinase
MLSAGAAGAQVPAAGHGPYFPADAPWYQDVSTAPVDAESSTVIGWLAGVGGWGGGRMQIDFSIEVLEADASTPFRSFTRTGDFFNPDCDFAPVPLPAGGTLEGENGYECVSDGDCHLLVVHRPSHRLYEMWRANVDASNQFFGGCLAVWNMDLTYPSAGRGQDCTSADAAGYPIAPLLFSADEVAAGHIDHAIRFILPNSRMRRLVYVHPATHSTGSTSGPASAPPYGTRLRLRADYPIQNLPAGAQVVARAMQKYGIVLADGGTIALTAQSDRFTTAKWSGLLDPLDLSALRVTDFEMVAGGQRYSYTGDCARTSPLFNDAFELGGTSKWSAATP